MIARGYDAWKHNETLRQWFEVVLDTTATPPEHTAYVCKSCWEQFPANTDVLGLLGHATRHDTEVEPPYSSSRPTPVSGEQVFEMYRAISERFEAVTPEVGAWKFECKVCKVLLPHRSTHRDLMEHAKFCAFTNSSGGKMRVTDPSYISQQMFDKALNERFLGNSDDEGVRQQAMLLMQMLTKSKLRGEVQTNIQHASKVSGHTSKEQIAEIAFCMGLQFGFELACTFPPLAPK